MSNPLEHLTLHQLKQELLRRGIQFRALGGNHIMIATSAFAPPKPKPSLNETLTRITGGKNGK